METKGWEVGKVSENGRWVKFTTVYAATEAEAREKATDQLRRPGRLDFYKDWKAGGEIVREA